MKAKAKNNLEQFLDDLRHNIEADIHQDAGDWSPLSQSDGVFIRRIMKETLSGYLKAD
jgi:hypothetical protein